MENTKNYLTASEAHNIAENWQGNAVSEYVSTALRDIRKAADKGKFSETILRPSGGVNPDVCYDALVSLGYKVDRQYTQNYIAVKW